MGRRGRLRVYAWLEICLNEVIPRSLISVIGCSMLLYILADVSCMSLTMDRICAIKYGFCAISCAI